MTDFLPKVTVVIPTYNAESFIERTVRSAASQTYPNLQILVIDDGSKDNSRRIVEDLCQEIPFLKIETVKNGGVARARNIGTELAEDGYVAYLDADDLWHPQKIEKQVEALAQHAGDDSWGACYVGFRLIDTDDHPFADGALYEESGDFFFDHLLINHAGNGSVLLVRRDVALEVGGFDPSYAEKGIGGCEDRDFHLKILQKYKIEVVPEFLVGYRVHPESMSTNKSAIALGQFAVIENFLKDPRLNDRMRRRALGAAHRSAIIKFWRSRLYLQSVRSLVLHLWLDPYHGLVRSLTRLYFFGRRRVLYLFWLVSERHNRHLGTRDFLMLDPSRSLFSQAIYYSPPDAAGPNRSVTDDV